MIDEIDRSDPLATAVRSALGDIVATTPEPTAEPFNAMPTFVSQGSRRVPVLIGSVALAAAASLAIVVVATRDNRQPDAPAAANGPSTSATSAPAPAPAVSWPVHLAPGLTPWYEANDPVTAALGAPQVGPTQARVQCTAWTAADGVVNCTALTGEGYLPAVGYSQGNRWVDIATLHSDIGVAAYAHNYSQGKDVGYDSAPLPLQDVTVAGQPGKLVETATGITRVTIEPVPGTLVSVEVGGGLTRADALTIAAGVRPTTATPTIPLVIAQSAPDADGMRVTAPGGVSGGNFCLVTDAGCATLSGDEPVRVQQMFQGRVGFAGLAAADVASLRITNADGTTTDVALEPAAVGTVKAFAIDMAPGATVIPLDASGTPIDLPGGSPMTAPNNTEVTPTTSQIPDTTPPHA
jgi:hypothetical protein